MSMLETVAVFVGIPAAVYGVIAALVYLSAGRTSGRRYRPGRPYDFTAVWFVSAGAARPPAAAAGSALEAAPHRELEAPPAAGAAMTDRAGATGSRGGARGNW